MSILIATATYLVSIFAYSTISEAIDASQDDNHDK